MVDNNNESQNATESKTEATGDGMKEEEECSSSSHPSSSFQLPTHEPITTLSPNQDHSLLSIGTSNGSVHFLATPSLHPLGSVSLADPDDSSVVSVFSSTFHPTLPDICYFGTSGGRVNVLSVPTQGQEPFHQSFQVHGASVLDMAFSSSSSPFYLATASADRSVSIFSFDESGGSQEGGAAMQQEEESSSSSSPHPLPLFSLENKHNQVLSYHSDEVNRVAFNQHQLLASCSDDCTMKLYRQEPSSSSSFHLIRDFREAVQEVFDLTFHSQNPNLIFSGSFDSLVRKYDIEYNSMLLSYQKECSPILSIDVNSSFVVSGHLGGIVNLFEENSGKHLFGFKLPHDVLKVRLNGQRDHLLSVSYQDGSIGVFDLRKV